MLINVYGYLSKGLLCIESLPHSRDNAYCKLTLKDEQGSQVEISVKAKDLFIAAQAMEKMQVKHK